MQEVFLLSGKFPIYTEFEFRQDILDLEANYTDLGLTIFDSFELKGLLIYIFDINTLNTFNNQRTNSFWLIVVTSPILDESPTLVAELVTTGGCAPF